MPSHAHSFVFGYTDQEDAIILFFSSRRLDINVIREILWVKLRSDRSWDSVGRRLGAIQRDMRNGGYGSPHSRGSVVWDLDAVDAWLAAWTPRHRRSELLELVSIDADTADAIEHVSIGIPLEEEDTLFKTDSW